MAHGTHRVQPGDLITAAHWNGLVDELEDALARIATLEGGTGTGTGSSLAITGLQPETGPYRVGSSLAVLGHGFEVSSGNARVFLDGVRVQVLDSASTDTRIAFTIPPVPGVVEPGVPATLRVVTSQGEATRHLVLRPALPTLFGEVDVQWLGIDPATPQPDQPVTFQYSVRSRASETADFLVQPSVQVASGQATWNGRLQVLDAALNPISSRLVRLDPLQTRLFHVRISQVPSGTAGTAFTLTVGASSGGVTGSSGAQPFEVGTAADAPDTTIALVATGAEPPAALSGTTVTAAAGGETVRVELALAFQVPGTYDLTVGAGTATSGWTVSRSASTPAQLTIGAGDIGADGFAHRLATVRIQATSSASTSGTADVRLQRQGAANSRTLSFSLTRA